MNQVIFVVPPTTQLLDLAGPVQAFSEANSLGASFRLRYAGLQAQATTAQGLAFANLEPFTQIALEPGDLLIIAGIQSQQLTPAALAQLGEPFYAWLRAAHSIGAKLISICNAAFILAHAGILAGKKCTTHWMRLATLAKRYPEIVVLEHRLFVKDGSVYTSAGICSGLDLALALIEESMGPTFTAKVAQMLVLYLRRDGFQPQQSVYLDYRTHLNPRIHQVQNLVAKDPGGTQTLETLAAQVHMSPRHLTRQFKKETGITVKTYTTLIRMEKAEKLLRNPNLSMEAIASACGFQDARQLRRLWRKFKGCSPAESRRTLPSAGA